MTNKNHFLKDSLPNPASWVMDGVDHINITPSGLTDLGRTLHPNSMLGFTHDVFGDFGSVSAFWDFIETGAQFNNIRNMKTMDRMSFMKRVAKLKVDGLLYFVLDAIWQRVNTYKLLADSIVETTLPFDSYNFVGEFNYPTRRNNSTWMIKGFEDIRVALKTQTEPNFQGLMLGKTREALINQYMETFVKTQKSEMPLANRLTNPGNKNLLLSALQSSVEAPRVFRRNPVVVEKLFQDKEIKKPLLSLVTTPETEA